MNSSAYLIARSLFRYWSTGSMKLTPKLRPDNASQPPRDTQLFKRFLQVGGEKRGLPMGGKSLISDLALGRQVVADEAWMRPVGIQRNFAGLAHRQDL